MARVPHLFSLRGVDGCLKIGRAPILTKYPISFIRGRVGSNFASMLKYQIPTAALDLNVPLSPSFGKDDRAAASFMAYCSSAITQQKRVSAYR
jgi:hypothetical protein